MSRSEIQDIERYVRDLMPEQVAHDFKHAARVRRWALRIAQAEGYPRPDMVEAAALLHDIGRARAEAERDHATAGAEMALIYLRSHGLFSELEIEEIAHAIRYHNAIGGSRSQLQAILRDADILDMLGAVGVMRALTSKAHLPEYDPEGVKGETWGWGARDFGVMFQQGTFSGLYITDQINMQASSFDSLSTCAARRVARPLVAYMRDFVRQLEVEVVQKMDGGRENEAT